MKTFHFDNQYGVWFDSISEQMEESTKAFHRRSETDRKNVTVCLSDRSFTGRLFYSIDAAVKAQNEVWQEGMNIADQCKKQIEDEMLPMPTDVRRRLRWNEYEGDEVDIDRLRSGQSYWRESHRASMTSPKIITLILNCSAQASMNVNQIMFRGMATIVLAEKLEQFGYRCEILSVNQTIGTYQDRSTSGGFTVVNLKDAHSPIDLVGLINNTSGWSFRTLWFMSKITHPACPAITAGLGSSQYTMKFPSDFFPENSIFCEGVYSLDAAATWIRDSITQLKDKER